MKRMLLVAVLLLAPAAWADSPAPKVAPFTTLPKGDRLVISYQALNCFGPSMNAEFVYSPHGKGEFEVCQLRFSRALMGSGLITNRVPLGRILLESGEAQQLDALIAAYRQPKHLEIVRLSGNVTYTLRQMRGNQVVAEEILYDPDDKLDPGQRPSLDFQILLAAFKPGA
jgi:hypothetical protein